MTNLNLDAAAAAVAEGVAANGGASVSATTGQTPTRGYMVAVPGHELQIDLATGGTGQIILAYAHGKRHALAQTNRYLGAWVDNGTLYLDVAECIAERATAERLGRERGELAIFDVEGGDSIYL